MRCAAASDVVSQTDCGSTLGIALNPDWGLGMSVGFSELVLDSMLVSVSVSCEASIDPFDRWNGLSAGVESGEGIDLKGRWPELDFSFLLRSSRIRRIRFCMLCAPFWRMPVGCRRSATTIRTHRRPAQGGRNRDTAAQLPAILFLAARATNPRPELAINPPCRTLVQGLPWFRGGQTFWHSSLLSACILHFCAVV